MLTVTWEPEDESQESHLGKRFFISIISYFWFQSCSLDMAPQSAIPSRTSVMKFFSTRSWLCLFTSDSELKKLSRRSISILYLEIMPRESFLKLLRKANDCFEICSFLKMSFPQLQSLSCLSIPRFHFFPCSPISIFSFLSFHFYLSRHFNFFSVLSFFLFISFVSFLANWITNFPVW